MLLKPPAHAPWKIARIGSILATVEVAASAERVFRALASREIVDWWVRHGVFDTTQWQGDVRIGGHWRDSRT